MRRCGSSRTSRADTSCGEGFWRNWAGSRKRAWNWRLRKRPLSRNWAKNERRAKKTACLIPNLLETRNRKKRARSGILQRRSLPRAARLFKRLSDGENEFFFKGPADDLHADRKALVGKADWDGCAGKAGQIRPLRKTHGVAIAGAG